MLTLGIKYERPCPENDAQLPLPNPFPNCTIHIYASKGHKTMEHEIHEQANTCPLKLYHGTQRSHSSHAKHFIIQNQCVKSIKLQNSIGKVN